LADPNVIPENLLVTSALASAVIGVAMLQNKKKPPSPSKAVLINKDV
jgi:hypothetical protein